MGKLSVADDRFTRDVSCDPGILECVLEEMRGDAIFCPEDFDKMSPWFFAGRLVDHSQAPAESVDRCSPVRFTY